MLAIAFRFPGGRYHATPWGRHVNEAAVAWPPEPWRLLRALLAVWHRKLDPVRWPRARLAALLDRLAAQPPHYHLPPAVHAHTRHYLPVRDKTTLVFDAFARVNPARPLIAVWPGLDLADDDQALLDALLDALGYLGRAESWVEAERCAPPGGEADCQPVADGDPEASAPDADIDADADAAPPTDAGTASALHAAAARGDVIRLLAARPATDYAAFRARALADFGRARRIDDTLPADWLDALATDTGALQKAGWNRPPAATEVAYRRRRDTLAVRAPLPQRRPPAPPAAAIDTVRYALYGRPLPRIEDAIRIGEWLRASGSTAIRRAGMAVPPSISGHDLPPGQSHGHAFWLAESTGGDGRIDHVLIHVPAGIPAAVLGALAGLDTLTGSRERAWRMLPEWFGRADTPPSDAGSRLARACVWRSATPYLCPWHAKRGFGVAEQVRRECRERGLPEPEVADCQHLQIGTRRLRPLDFHRFRHKPVEVQPDTRGHALELRFPEPVPGPLALGFGCHFGLGAFEHEPSARDGT